MSDVDRSSIKRVILLRAYIDLLHEAGLLRPEDPTCKLFACIDDDRRTFVVLQDEG